MGVLATAAPRTQHRMVDSSWAGTQVRPPFLNPKYIFHIVHKQNVIAPLGSGIYSNNERISICTAKAVTASLSSKQISYCLHPSSPGDYR